MNADLADAIARARVADRLTRIEWRTPIARHGVGAIDAVAPWMTDPELGAFAVRVIEAAAGFGAKQEAVDALRSVGRLGLTPPVQRDVEDALGRLAPRPASTSSGASRVRLRPTDGWDWPGFAEDDFGQITGTSWRRRSDPVAMVPLVLRPLLDIDPGFSSWAIYGSPEVHLAVEDRYHQGGEWGQGWRASKLVVYANGSFGDDARAPAHVAAGWSIEKGDGSPEFGAVNRELWDWPRLLELLVDPGRRAALEAVVATHDLRIGDHIGGGFTRKGAVMGFRERLEDGELVLRAVDGGRRIAKDWDALLDRLETLDRTQWHDLHIWREWPAADAIAMGQPFAPREVVPVLVDVAHMYLDTVWQGGR